MPRGEEWLRRAEATPAELPYTMLASTYEVMALSCSRWPLPRGPPPQLGAERKKGMQLWRPVRGSEDGIWERARMKMERMKVRHDVCKVRGDNTGLFGVDLLKAVLCSLGRAWC